MQSEQSLNLYQSKNGASPGYRVPQEHETEYDLGVSINMDNINNMETTFVNPIDEGAVLYQGDDWDGKYGDQDLEWRRLRPTTRNASSSEYEYE
jgi:hypothetical protein